MDAWIDGLRFYCGSQNEEHPANSIHGASAGEVLRRQRSRSNLISNAAKEREGGAANGAAEAWAAVHGQDDQGKAIEVIYGKHSFDTNGSEGERALDRERADCMKPWDGSNR